MKNTTQQKSTTQLSGQVVDSVLELNKHNLSSLDLTHLLLEP